jgi:hypothetical protein
MDREPLTPEVLGEERPEHHFWISRASTAQTPRGSLRRHPDLEVKIHQGLGYTAMCRVRDLSMDGAFVEIQVGPLPQLSRHIEMVLLCSYKDQDIELRLPATVTRVTGRGVALRFGYYDDRTYTDLANLLYAQ